ncbi:hypothetical protein ACFW17_34015 [Streptomyces sp. NPDC058961]|uniref:hypothetical protein n=1 Tax=Streptomyces sp. NPDC058961 TaxID=3346680 RepID=UPI0036BDD5C3
MVIHPERVGLVRTRELLARDMGMAMGTFRNRKPYAEPGFPRPVSSPGARVMLWDGGQTDAYRAGDPVPVLPEPGGAGDLLDRQEVAVELGVAPRTWDGYKRDPRVAEHLVVICGVEHWPRGIVREFQQARPGKSGATGRPRGSANVLPRGQAEDRVAALLAARPAITISEACDALGIAPATAQRALAQVRGKRIAELVEAEPGLSFTAAAEELGYPTAVRRAAVEAARMAGNRT